MATHDTEQLIIRHEEAIACLRIVAEAVYEIPPSLPLPGEVSSALKGAVLAVQRTAGDLIAGLE